MCSNYLVWWVGTDILKTYDAKDYQGIPLYIAEQMKQMLENPRKCHLWIPSNMEYLGIKLNWSDHIPITRMLSYMSFNGVAFFSEDYSKVRTFMGFFTDLNISLLSKYNITATFNNFLEGDI